MVKAHSLLYAVYICLLMAILCGGLLLLSNLYNQLNLYYVTHESLYISNQSAVNYALGNNLLLEEDELKEETGIHSLFSVKKHGLLPLLLTQSVVQNDTVSSAYFIGQRNLKDKTALYMANFSQPLNLSGNVTINGDVFMPTEQFKETYINNKPNTVRFKGNKKKSEIQLPSISNQCTSIFEIKNNDKVALDAIEKKNDSIYVNSFFKETVTLKINSTVLSNKIIKGNFIITASDSIYIRKNNVLEDVIIMAPKIAIEEGFTGNIQIFAKESITIEKEVTLNYPSIVALYNNEKDKKTFIKINKEVKVAGTVFLFGNDIVHLDTNTLEIEEKGTIIGTVYCTGILTLKSDVYGSVITNKINHKTAITSYSNTLADIIIDVAKKPNYFIDMPIFNNSNSNYAIIKKVL